MKLFSALQFSRSARMGKGISLSHDEMAILKGLLDDLEL